MVPYLPPTLHWEQSMGILRVRIRRVRLPAAGQRNGQEQAEGRGWKRKAAREARHGSSDLGWCQARGECHPSCAEQKGDNYPMSMSCIVAAHQGSHHPLKRGYLKTITQEHPGFLVENCFLALHFAPFPVLAVRCGWWPPTQTMQFTLLRILKLNLMETELHAQRKNLRLAMATLLVNHRGKIGTQACPLCHSTQCYCQHWRP